MLVLVFLLLVFAGTVPAEVYFNPNDSVVAICNVTTLTCVTNTGWLKWFTPIDDKTFITSSGLNEVAELVEHITVQLTSKVGPILTSVATITGSNSTLNGTMISCDDTRGTVRSKTLLIPEISKLGFKALSFNSSTLCWVTWPIINPECGHHYTIQLVAGDIVYINISTAATSLNVTGLIHGEEYTVTVFIAHRYKTILMTLEVPEAVTDLIINQLDIGINVSWKQPPSSRPPVVSYIIQHNITDNGSSLEEHTEQTYITIHRALPGHVYYIQVTPVNVLGSGTLSVVKTILTVTRSFPTTTSVSETTVTTDLPTTAGVLIIVSILCITLLMFGFCLVAAVLILKRKKRLKNSSNSATQQKKPLQRNVLHIYETLEQENHLYFIDSQELPNSLSLSSPPLPASIQPVSLPLQTPSPPPPLPPPLSLSPSPSPPPPPESPPATKPLPIARPGMVPPPSSPPPSPPPSPGSEADAVLHEYDKPLPVTRSRPGTGRK